MKKSKVICFFLSSLMLFGCMGHDLTSNNEVNKEQVDKNVKNVFGVDFDPTHDWTTTVNGEVSVNNIPNGTQKVQLFVYIDEEDGETSILKLNEAEINGETSIKLVYDVPSLNKGLYVSFITSNGMYVRKVNDNVASFARKTTRSATVNYPIPTVTPTISVIEESYASKRGWIEGEKLYGMSDYTTQAMNVGEYSEEFKNAFDVVIFSYFKNGRAYDNLPLVINSGFYNSKAYPITTGDEPIVVTPVYKRDGAKTYGNEVYNSDLYYYYYKGNNPTKEYLESLPKYKAIPFNEVFSDNEDNIIGKRNGYTLIYWGDGTPSEGTVGSYQFPKGYKIGFMVRAKTTYEGGKKQGELYSDGVLNSYINNYDKCNFKSSKLGDDGPRGAWITLEDKMFLCFESGTDRDFNDIIFEVEGGVKKIINIPDVEENYYTFCFEDTQLGDYDMNDVVLKASREDNTHVVWQLVACGAFDELKIMNINGQKINSNTEVHKIFGAEGGYINTQTKNYDIVTEKVKVDKSFSFLNESTQPYIIDITTRLTVKLSKVGEDPHGIMIPYDFKYPIEKICIKNAYGDFNSWGINKVTSTDWYKYPNEGYVFK